jgi:predicted nucleic-acid-binding protein
MIGLDTNVVVRLLVDDDPEQRKLARAFIARTCTPDDPGYINHIVLVETAWVLGSAYAFGRNEIASAIEGIMNVDEFSIEGPDLVRIALRASGGGADFSDALLGAVNASAGCKRTVTFDRAAALKIEGFDLVR